MTSPTAPVDVPVALLGYGTVGQSLAERGLTVDDLMPITFEDEEDGYTEKPSILVTDRSEMARLIAEQDVILSF